MLSSGQTFAVQAQAAVDQRAKELDQQAEALAQEKQRMSAAGIANNDVLDLDVGGVFFSVKRATLTQVSCPTTSTQLDLICTESIAMAL